MCAFKLCSGKAVARYSAGFGAITHMYIYIYTHTHTTAPLDFLGRDQLM